MWKIWDFFARTWLGNYGNYSSLLKHQSIVRYVESNTNSVVASVFQTHQRWRRHSKQYHLWKGQWWPNYLEDNLQNSCGSLLPSLSQRLFPMFTSRRSLFNLCRSFYQTWFLPEEVVEWNINLVKNTLKYHNKILGSALNDSLRLLICSLYSLQPFLQRLYWRWCWSGFPWVQPWGLHQLPQSSS